jgi:hypothetical protein
MTEEQFANVVNVTMVIFGMLFALIVGYHIGYKDGKNE